MMRAAPPVRLSIAPSPATARAVALLAALAAASGAAWAAGRAGWADVPCALAAAAAALAAALLARRAWPRDELTLDWDARRWALAGPAGAAQAGELAVAIDLGPWLLLRFRPAEPPRRARWIALQRAAHAAQWHALRCAVYSPRPDAGAAAAERAASDTHDRP